MKPLAGIVGALVLGLGCRGVPDPSLTQLAEARRVAAELHVELVKAAGASDRAVMADTDEESIAFARDAERAVGAVRTGLAELGTRLQRLGYGEETRLLDEVSARFVAYEKVDRDVRALAVENTNLKAQRLSFGPVREAADAVRDALEPLAQAAPPKERCGIEALVARAVLAVREIQVLQAPHIAEADDAAMNRLEKEMTARETAARGALRALAGASRAAVALEHFVSLSSELVALSRRNTNVRSLSLSLRQTPALAAACDTGLAALEEALAKRGFTATR